MTKYYNRFPLWANVTEAQWNNWRWQFKNRITTVDQLQQIINLSIEETEGIKTCLKSLRMAITPYYASLIDKDDLKCPIRRQAVPTIHEQTQSGIDDHLHETIDSPSPGLTHRYPDRVLLLLTDQCSTYCRHCTRRRLVGQQEKGFSPAKLSQAVDYIKNNKEIRDVLISGGDPFSLSDNKLEDTIRQIRSIKHVEIIRIGTRTPVVMPQRITKRLCNMLKKYQPLWINTHFNHPKEITNESKNACELIVDSGIPLGNQSVLLKNVNDCPYIMKSLVHDLLKIRVRPYYLYQCDIARGIEHFRTPVATGIKIIESLTGHTTGFGVPTFVIDLPEGLGKIPISPQYLISQSPDQIILRNYEGAIGSYPEPSNKNFSCNHCNLCKKFKNNSNGLEEILTKEKNSLLPEGNKRIKRRELFTKK